jgi:uncharacterized membrane protein
MTQRITLDELLGLLSRIQAEWLDEDGKKVLEEISRVIDKIGNASVNRTLIESILNSEPYALDVFFVAVEFLVDAFVPLIAFTAPSHGGGCFGGGGGGGFGGGGAGGR